MRHDIFSSFVGSFCRRPSHLSLILKRRYLFANFVINAVIKIAPRGTPSSFDTTRVSRCCLPGVYF